MATLALKPALPIRPRSSGSKRDHRPHRLRDALHSKPWQTAAITAGAMALTFFSVLAPIIDDPVGRLYTLDTTPTIPTEDAIRRDTRSMQALQAFEFTPTMLGPAITEEMLILAEADAWVVMPELEVHALPPIEVEGPTPPG
jgi:hypothetical protein